MKRQVGWRLNKLLLDRFDKLCRDEGLRASEVVEEFMRRCLTVGNVTEALNLIVDMEPKAVLARELKAKAIMADISGAIQEGSFLEDYYEFYDPKYRELLGLVPGIKDPKLIEEIKRFCERVNCVLKGAEG